MSKKRLVCGVGINDANYKVCIYETVNGRQKVVWKCPFYTRWVEMLSRCYSKRRQQRTPDYIGCSVCNEWLLFSNFKKWMERQEWAGCSLDKDLLTEGNKVYSPNTCLFIPQKLNAFIVSSRTRRGDLPLGVTYQKKKKDMKKNYSKPYVSQVGNNKDGQVFMGSFASPQEAHQIYLNEKLLQCENYISEFKGSPLVVAGLTRIKDKIQYHIDNNLELTEF